MENEPVEGDELSDEEEEDDTQEESDENEEDEEQREDEEDKEDQDELPQYEPEPEEEEEPYTPDPLPPLEDNQEALPDETPADVALDEQYEESDTSDANELEDIMSEPEQPEAIIDVGDVLDLPQFLEDEFINDLYGMAGFDETFDDGITGIEYDGFRVDDAFDELGFDTDALLW